MRRNRKLRYKISDRNTDQKLLTDRDKRYFYTSSTSATVQLTTRQQIVVITNNVAFTMILPSVSMVKGVSFTISILNSGSDVTLVDHPSATFSDSSSWGGPYTLATADDSITLRSTGVAWIVVSNDIQ